MYTPGSCESQTPISLERVVFVDPATRWSLPCVLCPGWTVDLCGVVPRSPLEAPEEIWGPLFQAEKLTVLNKTSSKASSLWGMRKGRPPEQPTASPNFQCCPMTMVMTMTRMWLKVFRFWFRYGLPIYYKVTHELAASFSIIKFWLSPESYDGRSIANWIHWFYLVV